jgi:hypothetical protein
MAITSGGVEIVSWAQPSPFNLFIQVLSTCGWEKYGSSLSRDRIVVGRKSVHITKVWSHTWGVLDTTVCLKVCQWSIIHDDENQKLAKITIDHYWYERFKRHNYNIKYICTIYTHLYTCLTYIPRFALREKVTLRLLKLFF